VNQLPKTETPAVCTIKTYTRDHHLRVSDNNTIDLGRFDGKLRYEKNICKYGIVAAKTAKHAGASETYVT